MVIAAGRPLAQPPPVYALITWSHPNTGQSHLDTTRTNTNFITRLITTPTSRSEEKLLRVRYARHSNKKK